jgi:hypothetical protein
MRLCPPTGSERIVGHSENGRALGVVRPVVPVSRRHVKLPCTAQTSDIRQHPTQSTRSHHRTTL